MTFSSCPRENEVEEAKEEGAKEMTLDEWKAQQDKERAKVDFNIRKANEGTDWKKGFLLHKSKAKDVSLVFLVHNSGEPLVYYVLRGIEVKV